MGKYSDSEAWQDIVPIPQDDGCANPLAAIAYTDEYSESMSYLRAVMAEDEKSDRVLGLTEEIIGMNPAHYTVWYYWISMLEVAGLLMYLAGYTEQTYSSYYRKTYSKSSSGLKLSLLRISKTSRYGASPTSSCHTTANVCIRSGTTVRW